MATIKGFILDNAGNIILPYTRAELVLDSKGNPALESEDFVATKSHPGLILPIEKARIAESAGILDYDSETKEVNLNREYVDNSTGTPTLKKEIVYPKTKASAVIVNESTNLDQIITPLLNIDTEPTKDSTNLVLSGGTWKCIDDTVGDINRILQTI